MRKTHSWKNWKILDNIPRSEKILLNIENGREQLPKINKVQGPVQEISKEEVVYAIKANEIR